MWSHCTTFPKVMFGKIKSLSTHTGLERSQNEGFHSKIVDIKTFGVDDIYSYEFENNLDFLDKKAIKKLRNYFAKEYYESSSKQYSLSHNCSTRLASSYEDPHRLYREWDNEIGENFTKILCIVSQKLVKGCHFKIIQSL